MSSRAEKRVEKSRSQKVADKPWRVIDVSEWVLCGLTLLIILALPWYFGCAQWKSQYLLAWVGVAVCASTAFHCLASLMSKSRDVSVPWLTWLFFFLGLVAFVQSRPVYSWLGTEIVPASVQIQRWALGLSDAPPSFHATLSSTPKTKTADGATTVPVVPCDLKDVPESERKLAWSIEPLHTRGAAASLFLCGLFVWVGRMVFSDPTKQLCLFCALTLIGVLISCVGIQGAISYQSLNFLGLKTGGSFATFVSKNSAGGFYNVCIAGCLGLLGWTLLHTQRSSKDTRYRFADKSLISKIRGFAEDSLADLNTAQITSVLCLVGIVSALLISLCRGAVVSALGAIIVAAFIANARNHSRGSWVILVTIATVFVACMVGFQIDDSAYARLESLSELDLEKELTDGRAYVWSIAWKAMAFYGWFGSGLGTFHYAYLPFQEPSTTIWFYHAESLYGQCGVELGFLGISILILAIVKILAELQRPAAKENWKAALPSKLAGTYLIVSQSFHSFVDFAIIVPALFVPAAVLIGSVIATIRKSEIAPSRKRSRSESATTTGPTEPKEVSGWRPRLLGVLVAALAATAIAFTTTSIQSLAASDSMEAWTKLEETKAIEDQSSKRVLKMAELWSMNNSSLRQNSTAMRAFADALIYDYRMNQMIATPPSSEWVKAWTNTSPMLLQLALERVKDQVMREQIIDSVGGKAALSLLERSAEWYAIGQTKSPLDWRLLWGRCRTNMVCEREEIAKLLPASMTTGKHNAQQLLETTLLFRDQFDQNQFEQILAQAMKSNPGAASNSAKLIAMESPDEDVSINLFPQRLDILEMIAREPFTKERFPRTNQRLWERAQELVAVAPMTTSNKEIWLANASVELGDANAEISHLRKAVKQEPNNIQLSIRLAKRLMDAMENDEAKAVVRQLQRTSTFDQEVKILADRILSL